MILKVLSHYGLCIRSRISWIFPWAWFAAVGLLLSTRGFPPILPAVKVIFAMFAAAICVYVFNDVQDSEMDKLSTGEKAERPLPTKRVSEGEAMTLVLISGLIGIALSLSVNLETFLFCLAYMILGLAYSSHRTRLKKRFLLKELTTATGCVLASLAGGAAAGFISAAVVFSGIFLFIYTVAVSPMFLDIGDIKEDREYGGKTLAMILGWKTRAEVIIFVVLVFMTITPLTYVHLGLNVITPILVVAFCLLFLRFTFPLLIRQDELSTRIRFLKAKQFGYRFFILFQIALILGSFPL